MKAISLWEPWATAMAAGLKQNETRGWDTRYRGDLVICAAKRRMDTEGILLYHDRIKPLTDPECRVHLPYGCAVAVVELYDCVRSEEFGRTGKRLLTEMEEALGNYAPLRWVWMTRNLRPILPAVPVLGRQGFFQVPYPLIEPNMMRMDGDGGQSGLDGQEEELELMPEEVKTARVWDPVDGAGGTPAVPGSMEGGTR